MLTITGIANYKITKKLLQILDIRNNKTSRKSFNYCA